MRLILPQFAKSNIQYHQHALCRAQEPCVTLGWLINDSQHLLTHTPVPATVSRESSRGTDMAADLRHTYQLAGEDDPVQGKED